jgi:hypothetical protein
MTDPGWIFWGLFAACLAIVLAYALWIWWVERP